MSKINSGILQNATPLSEEEIRVLENRAIEQHKTYVYLDQNGKLCFIAPKGIDGLRDLAWHNAYELTDSSGTLTKKSYEKTGLGTFALDKVFTKSEISADWCMSEVFTFDGNVVGYYFINLGDATSTTLALKVSDRFFNADELMGSSMIISQLDDTGVHSSKTYTIGSSDCTAETFSDGILCTEVRVNDVQVLVAIDTSVSQNSYFTLDKGTYFVLPYAYDADKPSCYIESISSIGAEACLKPKAAIEAENVYSLGDTIKQVTDISELERTCVDASTYYIKVSERPLEYSDLAFSELTLSTFDSSESVILKPSDVIDVRGTDNIPFIGIIGFGDVEGSDIPFVLSVFDTLDLGLDSPFEKGLYFLYADGIFIDSISSLSKADAIYK